MELTLEQIKMLVYDARVMPNASIADLLNQFLPKPHKWTMAETIIEVGDDHRKFDKLTFQEVCRASLIYRPLESGGVEILKNRFAVVHGVVTKEELDTEIENIKILLDLEDN